MSNHKGLPPTWLDSSYMQNALRTGLDDITLSVQEIDVKPGSALGENFIGQIFRIISTLTNGKKISAIGKISATTDMTDQLTDVKDPFLTEASFFTKVVPIIKQFVDIHRAVPIPYLIDFDRKVIILEDLKEKGLSALPLEVMVNKDQARLTVEALGKLHGATYRLLQQDPSLKDDFSISVWSGERDGVLSKFVENGIRGLERWVDSYELPEGWSARLRGVMKRLDNEWFKVCEFREGRFNTLIHGDCWKSNLMYSKTEDQDQEMRLIDFQIVTYNSFANDLQYFLFTSVDADVLVNDLDYLIECYHDKLKDTAPDIPDLTLERVKSEFAERYFFGLTMSLTLRAMIESSVPIDGVKIMTGETQDGGFPDPLFRSDIVKLFPFFEKLGLI